MPAHKRIQTVGGGAAATEAATIVIGPDFGVASSGMITEALVGSSHQQEPTYGLALESEITAAELTAGTDLTAESLLALNELEAAFAPALISEQQATTHQFNVVELLTTKDAWVSTATLVGNCIDTANHDGQDLKVSDQAADNNASALIGFNLSHFPAGAVVQSATLHLVASLTAAVGTSYTIHGLASAAEGWAEATLVCSNAPATAAPSQNYSQPAATGAININLAATAGSWTTYLENRFGTAVTASFKIRDANVVGTSVVYHDSESGATLGPRLSITFRT